MGNLFFYVLCAYDGVENPGLDKYNHIHYIDILFSWTLAAH